jgi:ABC-type antimicrobial peptide transport system permease subunit
MQETIDQVKTIWEAQFPEYIFKYTFIDDQVRDLYKGERKLSTLVSVVAFMAIFIGCLGLLGLVMFMTNQRTKEIGVRKILGASAESVVLLLSKEFAKLILLGFAFAAPLAGLLMHKILEEFAYKTDLGPSVFLMSLLSTCMIAFVTVAYRSFIAATANPIESLRSE